MQLSDKMQSNNGIDYNHEKCFKLTISIAEGCKVAVLDKGWYYLTVILFRVFIEHQNEISQLVSRIYFYTLLVYV